MQTVGGDGCISKAQRVRGGNRRNGKWKPKKEEVWAETKKGGKRGWDLRDRGSEAQRLVELEQEREEAERDIGISMFMLQLPRYDEWPAETTVQLNANTSTVCTLPPVIHHLFLPWLC